MPTGNRSGETVVRKSQWNVFCTCDLSLWRHLWKSIEIYKYIGKPVSHEDKFTRKRQNSGAMRAFFALKLHFLKLANKTMLNRAKIPLISRNSRQERPPGIATILIQTIQKIEKYPFVWLIFLSNYNISYSHKHLTLFINIHTIVLRSNINPRQYG